MNFPITYDKNLMTLRIKIGKYYKYLQCPFATWWKGRKYFKKPIFKWYFGPTCKVHGTKYSKFGNFIDYTQKGLWPMASTEYLKWRTPKWFPVHIMSNDICWKDKWNSPRFERNGYFIIFFGRSFYKSWQLSLKISAPEVFCNNDCTYKDHEDNYWESILWYLNYADQYNNDYNIPDLYKARDSMMRNHWSTSKRTDIIDWNLYDYGHETLNMGNGQYKEFMTVDITSDKIYNKIIDNLYYSGKYLYTDPKLLESNNVFISINDIDSSDGTEKSIFESTEYIRIIKDSEDSSNGKKYIRLYFNNYDNKLYEFLKVCKNITISYNRRIDLGPSFKDEFLNKEGIELIRKCYKESKNG